MYQDPLIGTDEWEMAGRAGAHGVELARRLGARVRAVHVTAPWTAVAIHDIAAPLPPENHERRAADRAREILADVAMSAKAVGVARETPRVHGRLPAEGILEAAARWGADVIVMASRGRSGVARLLLGGEANDVVSKSTVPVLICR